MMADLREMVETMIDEAIAGQRATIEALIAQAVATALGIEDGDGENEARGGVQADRNSLTDTARERRRVSMAEAARELGVSRSRLQAAVQRGDLHTRRQGRNVVVDLAEAERMMQDA